MGFTTPAFIRKNTPELRKKLEKLGYNHSTDVIEDERFCIAALRDDSNYMQWFIADSILSVSYDDLKKAEEMKIRKIASLRKQMEKLEKLSFKVEEI